MSFHRPSTAFFLSHSLFFTWNNPGLRLFDLRSLPWLIKNAAPRSRMHSSSKQAPLEGGREGAAHSEKTKIFRVNVFFSRRSTDLPPSPFRREINVSNNASLEIKLSYHSPFLAIFFLREEWRIFFNWKMVLNIVLCIDHAKRK